MVKQVAIELFGEDWPGTLEERGSGVLDKTNEEDEDELRIFVGLKSFPLSCAGIFLR
jgi:hypothetical protein